MACWACSSGVGSLGSISIIFLYMSYEEGEGEGEGEGEEGVRKERGWEGRDESIG